MDEFFSGLLSFLLLPFVIWELATPDVAGFKNLDRSGTLVGIDRNKNGIRDDIAKQVDQRIALPDANKHLKQLVKQHQLMLVDRELTDQEIASIRTNLTLSMSCLTLGYEDADRYTVKPDNHGQTKFLKEHPDPRNEKQKKYDEYRISQYQDAIKIAIQLHNIVGNTKKRRAIMKQHYAIFEGTMGNALMKPIKTNCK